MADTVIIPRLRRVLTERNLALDELHRRLVERGDAPSRATLARLAQERPIRSIRVDSILSVMEELELPFGALFETVPRAEWERRRAANGQAHAAAGELVRRRSTRATKADEETDTVIARLEQDLRVDSPDLFDDRGRLRKRALVTRLAERFGSRTVEGDEISRRINTVRAAQPGGRAS